MSDAMMKYAVIACLTVCGSASAQDWRVVGSDRMGVTVIENGLPIFSIKTEINGPRFLRAPLTALPTVENGERRYRQTVSFQKPMFSKIRDEDVFKGKLDIDYSARKTGDRSLEFLIRGRSDQVVQYENPNSKAPTPSIWLGPVLDATVEYFSSGKAVMEKTDGSQEEILLPPVMGNTANVKSLTLIATSGEGMKMVFTPPVTLHRDQGEIRGWMQSGPLKANEMYEQKVVLELPRPFVFQPDNLWVKTHDWFSLRAENDFSQPSIVSMDDWQEKPAGKHGFLQMKGADFAFEDGTPVKFWAVLFVNHMADKEDFDQWAPMLAKYGVNLGRMCFMGKPTGKQWNHYIRLQDPADGLKFDAEALARFDYGFAKLKEQGIYSGFCPFWGWFPTEADKKRFINYDELITVLRKSFPMEGSFYALTAIAPDVQDLQIQFHVNLLNHVNPHTGLRYADDPAVAYVELQNEEDIFLGTQNLEAALAQCPTYKKLFFERFAQWLKEKYRTPEALAAAWGTTLKKGESLEQATLNPFPAYFAGAAPNQRAADQMAFLYSVQSEYYRKFAKAVRGTGYKGPVIGSGWQASNWVGHLLNVMSDREIGHIDRHNYNGADLKNPGRGLMSAGFQAVLDRPFAFSEWNGGSRVGMAPDLPMVAVYGMGLQGWDMSMCFGWKSAGVTNWTNGLNQYANNFNVLTQFPAMARMVRRGDVKEGEVVANRRISIPSLLQKGDVGFTESFSLLGGANNKSFNPAVPVESLAAGRVVLEYVDGPVAEPIMDKSAPYIDRKAGLVRSVTGQLLWNTKGEGFFTVNTPGTKAVVGYCGGELLELGETTIMTPNPYAQIYVSALGKDETIADAKRILITTIARQVDKGTVFDELGAKALVTPKPGKGPLLIEPVKATIEIKGRKAGTLFALDHDGRKPADAKPSPVEKTKDGLRFQLDGAQSRTVYYLVEMD